MAKRNDRTIPIREARVLQSASLAHLRMLGLMGGERSLSSLRNDLAGAEWIPYRNLGNIFGAGGSSERHIAGDRRRPHAVPARKRVTKR